MYRCAEKASVSAEFHTTAFESTKTYYVNASALLLVGGRSLLALLGSVVGVGGRTRLGTGSETVGAHIFATLLLQRLSVSVQDGASFGWTYLGRLDAGGISLGHFASLSRHVDGGWRGGLVGWKLCWLMSVKLKFAGGLVYCEEGGYESRYLCLVLLSKTSLARSST